MLGATLHTGRLPEPMIIQNLACAGCHFTHGSFTRTHVDINNLFPQCVHANGQTECMGAGRLTDRRYWMSGYVAVSMPDGLSGWLDGGAG